MKINMQFFYTISSFCLLSIQWNINIIKWLINEPFTVRAQLVSFLNDHFFHGKIIKHNLFVSNISKINAFFQT
jgi:hypothetical protein